MIGIWNSDPQSCSMTPTEDSCSTITVSASITRFGVELCDESPTVEAWMRGWMSVTRAYAGVCVDECCCE